MMNKTIKTMIVSGLFLCTISATAQEEFNEMRPPFPQQEEGKAPFKEVPNPEKSAKRITEEMSKELGLTEKQYKKVYKVILKEQKTLVENSRAKPSANDARWSGSRRKTDDGKSWRTSAHGHGTWRRNAFTKTTENG